MLLRLGCLPRQMTGVYVAGANRNQSRRLFTSTFVFVFTSTTVHVNFELLHHVPNYLRLDVRKCDSDPEGDLLVCLKRE